MKWQSIRREFVSSLEKIANQKSFQCKKYISRERNTNNILQLSGSINCLLYFKIRSEAPYRWGVTKPRVKELEAISKNWFIILLYESPDNGYLLSSGEARRYIGEGLWPLGKGRNRNEYKIRPGRPLQYNQPFSKFSKFIKSLELKIA